MAPSLALLFLLPTLSAGFAQEGCHGQQKYAAAGSSSMLQIQIRDHYETRSHSETFAAMNSSYSSTLFIHTKDNKELFSKIASKGAELKELIDVFLQSDFMKKLCGDTASTGQSWECDPSNLSPEDLEKLLGQLNNTVVGQEALDAWIQIVDLVKKPMAWIQEILDEWLPKLKQIVTETLEKLKTSGMENYFDGANFGLNDFVELFQKKDGKYGLTRFFEASAYVAEELDASKVVSEMVDDFAELFTKLQAAIMALEGKAFDFLKEKSILDALQSVKTEIDAFFEKVKKDFFDFGKAKTFLEDQSNKDVWEGKDIITLGKLCIPGSGEFNQADCQVLTGAAGHAAKVTLAWQAIRILNEVGDSNTRLLQASEPSEDKHIQMSVSTGSPNADKAINPEATKMKSEMEAVNNEIKAKAPDAAFGGSSASLPGPLGDSAR
jgi:hypothetical protein